ncbi:MAG: nuclear transport factor 2 family protein [Oscillospiraceae bacterium]|nr:nuclear transport factor 2 family protein [Oscillospiraceae bacterium]
MRQFTEEERIARVWDKEEAKKVLFRNMYYMAGNQRQEALDRLWVQEPAHTATASFGKNWGYYIGMDEIRRYYVDGNPFGGKGTMNCHPVATIRVEEAKDGETILCQWYNASYETREVNGELTALWVCEKGNADLVKEADGWKIWHYFIGTDVQNEAGVNYADQPVDLPDAENPVAQEFGEPTLKMEAYITRYNYYPYPAIPEPYETYRPELGCGPEGNPNYKA